MEKDITERAREFEAEHRKEWNLKNGSKVYNKDDIHNDGGLHHSDCMHDEMTYEAFKEMRSWTGGDMSYAGYVNYMHESERNRQSS